MKILFILPAIGRKDGEEYIGTWKMESLMIATLKALTPTDVETCFFDDRIESIDYSIDVDMVAISVETYTASRAYRIAEKFRQRNIPVVMGGYHVTAVPDEAVEYADCVIIGNAESVWQQVIEDFGGGKLQKQYDGERGGIPLMPDRSVYGAKKYLPLSLIETGRGCPNHCEFCAITCFYHANYIPRPIPDIVEEIKRAKNKFVFFIDDNLSADRDHLISLCRAITPLKIKWTSQVSLAVAKDDELLQAMKKSGCQVLLIGFESLDKKNLDQMNKSWNYKLGERDELVRKMHKAGIGIYATFVFGFDADANETFEDTIKFAMKHKFFFAAFNHLLPFPGTPLYERLEESNRLLYEKWWLKDGYKYGDIPYRPLKMTPDELKDKCAAVRRQFFSPLNILKRGLASIRRNPNFMISLIFFSQNKALGKEVDRKLNLPVGIGLDEGGAK
ncbi:MAG: B12-binding domain-containing radical SAM protein [Oscillospiraceae bacterium]|nr:B12-binding domain-containing radical SAM protein [Oscillospiraceae bacterium]